MQRRRTVRGLAVLMGVLLTVGTAQLLAQPTVVIPSDLYLDDDNAGKQDGSALHPYRALRDSLHDDARFEKGCVRRLERRKPAGLSRCFDVHLGLATIFRFDGRFLPVSRYDLLPTLESIIIAAALWAASRWWRHPSSTLFTGVSTSRSVACGE